MAGGMSEGGNSVQNGCHPSKDSIERSIDRQKPSQVLRAKKAHYFGQTRAIALVPRAEQLKTGSNRHKKNKGYATYSSRSGRNCYHKIYLTFPKS